MDKNQNRLFLFFAAALLGTVGIGHFSEQSDFWQIIFGMLLMLGFYFFALKNAREECLKWAIFSGIILRVILVPGIPPMSDDYFRFIWDGMNFWDGISPYLYKPDELLEISNNSIYQELHPHLNSKEYYSVYPPVLQSIFIFSTIFGTKHLIINIVLMKLVLLLCEIGSIIIISKLLDKFKLPKWYILIYALNPLVIIEIVGNIHFEGVMIFFVLLSLYLLSLFQKKKKYLFLIGSSIALAFAVGAKLIPLIFLPFLLPKLGWGRMIVYSLIVVLVSACLFLPLWDVELLSNFKESIDLYYRRFEFNGGVYYGINEIYKYFVGWYNIKVVGPALALVSAVSIIILAFADWNKKIERLPLLFMFGFTIYQMCSTTVHPWYIAPVVALSCLTNYRYAVMWSVLILFTYVNYSYPIYHVNYYVIAIEYFLVIAFLVYELYWKRKIAAIDSGY